MIKVRTEGGNVLHNAPACSSLSHILNICTSSDTHQECISLNMEFPPGYIYTKSLANQTWNLGLKARHCVNLEY